MEQARTIGHAFVFDTYMAVVKNSVGSTAFRNFYTDKDHKRRDVVENGRLSCAFFVSAILVMFRYIAEIHATVLGTVKDLKASGWQEIQVPEIGSILVWEQAAPGTDESHTHIGFYIGNDKAISNSSRLGYPVEHHWNFNGTRNVDSILWNPRIVSGSAS